MKNKIKLSAIKDNKVVVCSIKIVKMYARWREIGSIEILLWLAMRVGAVNQQVKINKGDEISSIKKYGFKKGEVFWLKNQAVEKAATINDWVVMDSHNRLAGVSHVDSIRTERGTIIVNTVKYLRS